MSTSFKGVFMSEAPARKSPTDRLRHIIRLSGNKLFNIQVIGHDRNAKQKLPVQKRQVRLESNLNPRYKGLMNTETELRCRHVQK